MEDCEHMCSGNCRREGCNCDCGEYHHACGISRKQLENARKYHYWRGFRVATIFWVLVLVTILSIII